MDNKRVQSAVIIKVTLDKVRNGIQYKQLLSDLHRLKEGMTTEEYSEYQRRIA